MTNQLEQFVQEVLDQGYSTKDILVALETKKSELQTNKTKKESKKTS